MNPNIFISYSREDERQALHLLDMLRREGYSVWIDQEAIAGASIWSDEIVQNIKSSQIFIALLSAASVASDNVGKEIALAAEHGKTILPIEIGSVTLPGRLEYALAGIQRTGFSDHEAILHAVRSQVARLEGIAASAINSQSRSRFKRFQPLILSAGAVLAALVLFLFFRRAPEVPMKANSFAVLPFETLNLDQDSTRNLDIFSEGLETRLSTLKSIAPIAASVSMSYKNSELKALAIAEELKARFVIEGLVRKEHDVNFVSARVVDAKKGGEVWEQSYSGNNVELFALRERMMNDILGFLRYVTNNEQDIQSAEANLQSHPNDASAYARLGNLLIASDKNRSYELMQKAIHFDSTNIAYYLTAGIVAQRVGFDGHDFGRDALALCSTRLKTHPDSIPLISSYMIALDLAGYDNEAMHKYDSLMPLYPSEVRLNYNAACCFAKQGKPDEAVSILERLFTFAPGKRAEVQSDPDFDNIRSLPQYQKLMYSK